MSYQSDRAFSDQFLPTLRTLIGPHLLVPSSLEQDRHQASDLVVLRGHDLTIACRVRRPGFAHRFPRQFTLRCRRDTGVMTEMRKVLYGWGDWMFYGHAVREDDCAIDPWWLIDLSHFRAHLALEAYRATRTIRQGAQANGDGTHFQYFEIDSFPPDPPLIIAESPTSVCVPVGVSRLRIPTVDEIFK